MEISIEKIATIISAAIASVVLFLYLGISLYIRDRNKKKSLIEKIQNSGSLIELQDTIAEGAPDGARTSTLKIFMSLGGYFLKGNTALHSQTKLNLLRAGLQHDDLIAKFWGVKCALGIVLPVTFFLLRVIVFKLIDPTITAGVCIGLAITGFYLPNVFLKIKTSARQEKIFQGLPDALDILVV
jgi:tight adherence protein C